MEFWGVEVKAGQPLKVKPIYENIIHLSQASLGEPKKEKGHDSVPLFVKFGDQKLVLGTLLTDTIPQLAFDLVFEKEFELSHNWKNGSVYFCGYQTPLPHDGSDDFDMDESEDEEEELPMIAVENGKAGPKAEKEKAPVKANPDKPEVSAKPTKAINFEENDDHESDDSDDNMSEDDDSEEMSDEEGGSAEDEDDSEDEDSDEDEETPKKAEVGKKRQTESATKTLVPAKKQKSAATPQTDSKKGGHVATPYPSKKAGKTPNDKTPKSGSQFTCKSCSKSFGSDNALQSHTKAKHTAGK